MALDDRLAAALAELESGDVKPAPVPEDIASAFAQLKDAITKELPEVPMILKHIHGMLAASGDAMYLLSDQQIADLYDAMLPKAREQITPVKVKATTARKVKNELDAFMKDLAKEAGDMSADDF